MAEIAIPYGKKRLLADIPEKHTVQIIYPRTIDHKNNRQILSQAMSRPLGDRSLREFMTNARRVLIIINDATRPTITPDVLDLLEDTINKQSRFLIATGAHRAPNTEEMSAIFGKHFGRYQEQILIHDSKDDMMLQSIGKTRHGNELYLNKQVVNAEKIFVISSVEPHYFAGYTGGRKSFLPGVAGYNTIENNHKFALHCQARSLNLAGNPVHEEMVDCVQILGQDRIYSLQMVLSNDRNVIDAFGGPIDTTFEQATQIAKECFSAQIRTKADVVVSVSRPPFDVNLYQTLKAIEHGRLALNEGGTLIVVSACTEGLGPNSFARLFTERSSMAHAVEHSKVQYRLGDHNAVNLVKLVKQGRLFAITDIDSRILENAGITPCRILARAIEQASAIKGRPIKILILMNGALTVPVVDKTA